MLDEGKIINNINRFLAQYGKILPSDFIPQLKNKAPLLVLENGDTDANLPAIDGLHNSTHPSNPAHPASIDFFRGRNA